MAGGKGLMCNVTSFRLSQIPAQMVWYRILRPGKSYVLTKLRATKIRGHHCSVWTTIPSSALMPLRPDNVQELDIPFSDADLRPPPQPTKGRSRQEEPARESTVLHYLVSEKEVILEIVAQKM